MKPIFFYLTLFFFIIIGNTNGYSTENRLTILHTNDLHSHFLGFSPNSDYSPQVTGNDKTIGGWARIATVIQTEKSKRKNACLVLDAGDFLMGSLFHMVSREEAFELELMKEMGYDLTTLGNHEFDLKPEGLAKIIAAAAAKGKMPQIVSSNIIFDPLDKEDDRLEALFTQGVVKPYTVLKKGNLKIGFFGLVGKDAASVAPFASPVKFADTVETAKQMVKVLKEQEGVDLVICLSHGGLEDEKNKSEDVMLAQSVSGIDIIISGHTHTDLAQPIIQNGTIIVQAGAYGKQIGVLDVIANGDGVKLEQYKTILVDDTIKGDDRIIQKIDSAKQLINQKVLKPYQLLFDQVLVETDFDLRLETDESNLGNLIADATKWSVNNAEYSPDDPQSRVVVSIQSNGVIRDNIIKGSTGQVSVSDLFRVVPLGIGWDGTLSYPLVSFYVTGSEMKKACEVLTTVYPMKNSDYFLQLSGLKLTYNNNRMFFDRVTKISIEDENGDFQPLDYSDANTRLYKVVSNIYNATFLKVIGSFTNGILTIVPKDKAGRSIDNFTDTRVDGDRNKEGIQEIKDWTALMGYVQSFQDKDGDGVPEIPEKYRGLLGRQTRDTSLNPYKLLAGGNYLTWIAFGCIILALALIPLIIMVPVWILKKRRLKAYKHGSTS
jgi:5'-nucleotidase / UDP-sugar diphosphatase